MIPGLAELPSPLQAWDEPVFRDHSLRVWIKRDDLIHPWVGGNKFRKLRDQLSPDRLAGKSGIISFGGPVSNHLMALAVVAGDLGVPFRAFIRGEPSNHPAVALLDRLGARSMYVPRARWPEAMDTFGQADWLTIPMGGSSTLAVSGVADSVAEIREQLPEGPIHLCVPAGTGGTAAGLASALSAEDGLHVYPAIRGVSGKTWMDANLAALGVASDCEISVYPESAGQGFARKDQDLWATLVRISERTGIWWDPVYGGKMLAMFLRQVHQGRFPEGARLVLLHTGGLPGLIGYRDRFGLPPMPNTPVSLSGLIR